MEFHELQIERIQNPTLYTQYMAKKKQMELANPSGNVERILWHGTNWQVVDNINKKGFDRNYNSGTFRLSQQLHLDILLKI